MPRRDGSGPLGQGPLTGRGLGLCSGDFWPGVAGMAAGVGIGLGMRYGWGRMRSGGRRGFGLAATNPVPVDEAGMLKQRARLLEQELNQIKEKLDLLAKE